jgi:hypothetical protein
MKSSTISTEKKTATRLEKGKQRNYSSTINFKEKANIPSNLKASTKPQVSSSRALPKNISREDNNQNH